VAPRPPANCPHFFQSKLFAKRDQAPDRRRILQARHFYSFFCVFLRNVYILFTPRLRVFTKFLCPSGYSSVVKNEGVIMDYLMDILYVGGVVVFFLLIWALAQGCDKLGGGA
jgi:hypothetical protein